MHIPISLEKNIDDSYPIYIDTLPTITLDTKIAIITNPKVSGLHLNYLLNKLQAKELYIITIPDGEEYKNLDTIAHILDRLCEHRLDRKSMLIAFGGGVVGDMTGFSASIYQRGIDFIQIPTTLLSQVDASVGGKTGVNNRFGKNLIGAFYQPKAVYIDSTFLKTLPKREFGAGVAESIKMAVMFDAQMFASIENSDLQNEVSLMAMIKRAVELKAKVVAQDEKEAGVRAVLNYGHTFAHVIENLTGYKRYLHGEAVAIGMVMANYLSQALGYMTQAEVDRVEALLIRENLPTSFAVADEEAFYEQFFLDKKSQNQNLKFIIPNGIGDFKIVNSADYKELKSTLLDVLKKFKG